MLNLWILELGDNLRILYPGCRTAVGIVIARMWKQREKQRMDRSVLSAYTWRVERPMKMILDKI